MRSLPITKFSSQKIVIALVLIFMFLNTFSPLNFSPSAEATKYPFKLTIILEKSTYKLGEHVNVTWILTNIGEENVRLYTSIDWVPDFIIRDENFIHVFRYRFYVGQIEAIIPIASIAPGNNLTLTAIWKQIYDKWDDYKILHHVPPGTYYVAGIFIKYKYNVELETPMLRITIT